MTRTRRPSPPSPHVLRALDFRDDPAVCREIVTTIYSSMIVLAQELRQSAERLTVWSSGLVLIIVGWTVTRTDIPRKGLIVVSLGIVLLCLMTSLIIHTLSARYRYVALVKLRINQIQLAHEPGVYLEGEAVFPPHWAGFRYSEWREPIFAISHLTLFLFACLGGSIVWLV